MIAGVGADRGVVRGRPLEAQPSAAPFAERRVPRRYRLAPDGTGWGGGGGGGLESAGRARAEDGRPRGLQLVASAVPGCAGYDVPSLWNSWEEFLDPRMCLQSPQLPPRGRKSFPKQHI